MPPPRTAFVVPAAAALFAVAAALPSPVADLLRAGNEAFARRDWDAAEALYAEAEALTPDPGLVAFNKGLALYCRGDFRRAELCFRRTLSDAAIPAERRAQALYDLGNCLVRQAGDTDLKQLQAAIECFDRTVTAATDDGLRTDARHNLEVAKLLWARARAKKPPDERDPEWDKPPDPQRPPEAPRPPDLGPEEPGNGNPQGASGAKAELAKGPTAEGKGVETDRTTPGAGNLPVVPDTGEVTSLAPEDARAWLKQAAGRLQRERRKLREDAAQNDRPRTRDW